MCWFSVKKHTWALGLSVTALWSETKWLVMYRAMSLWTMKRREGRGRAFSRSRIFPVRLLFSSVPHFWAPVLTIDSSSFGLPISSRLHTLRPGVSNFSSLLLGCIHVVMDWMSVSPKFHVLKPSPPIWLYLERGPVWRLNEVIRLGALIW